LARGSRARGESARSDFRHRSHLVWGLAPAIYAVSGCRPATRWCFHQTLLVENSPLSRRWPDARARQLELLDLLHRDPPRWVVVVSGDRSGLEPQDSRTELEAFPELAGWLATQYRLRASTHSYRLLESGPAAAESAAPESDPVDNSASPR
jgi:hypothetical protein